MNGNNPNKDFARSHFEILVTEVNLKLAYFSHSLRTSIVSVCMVVSPVVNGGTP